MEREVEKLPLPEKLGKAPAYEPSASGDRRGRGGRKGRGEAKGRGGRAGERPKAAPREAVPDSGAASPAIAGTEGAEGRNTERRRHRGDVIAGAVASRPGVHLRYRAEGCLRRGAGTPDREYGKQRSRYLRGAGFFWRRSPNFTPELRRSPTVKAGLAPSPAMAEVNPEIRHSRGLSPIHTADRKKIRK